MQGSLRGPQGPCPSRCAPDHAGTEGAACAPQGPVWVTNVQTLLWFSKDETDGRWKTIGPTLRSGGQALRRPIIVEAHVELASGHGTQHGRFGRGCRLCACDRKLGRPGRPSGQTKGNAAGGALGPPHSASRRVTAVKRRRLAIKCRRFSANLRSIPSSPAQAPSGSGSFSNRWCPLWAAECVCFGQTLATSVCQPRYDQMEQGPTEPQTGRGAFLLSSGGARGGDY